MKQLIALPAIQPIRNKPGKPLRMIATWCLMCCAMMFAASAQAAYDVTIVATGTSSGGSWIGDTWTPSASGSTVLASEIATRLSSGPTIISTAGAGADNGDIFVNSAVSWSTNQLTLTAARNVAINANLNGSDTASLYLQYGFGTGVGDYTLSNGAQVNLPAGNNFSTQLNLTGLVTYTVITSLGVEGDATAAPSPMTLQGMRTGLAGKYVLGANIDASGTSTWNGGAGGLGFAPVGYVGPGPAYLPVYFTGAFDGLGHTITGLTINRVWENYVGLFGATNGVTLRNVGLINSSVTGQVYVGALQGLGIGGGSISYCYADGGSVTGTYNAGAQGVGGLAGISSAAISNSYATVSVTANSSISSIGGLVGRNNGAISNSYATGSVNGGPEVGGLVGMQNANITNSYATGAVTGSSNVGGLVGSVNGGATTTSYWNWETTGLPASASGTRIDTTALMQTQSTFTGFDFTTTPVWRIYEGHTYPLLASFLTPLTVTANAASKAYDGAAYSGGNGVGYSVTPNANLLGTVSYGGTSQGAINVGSYTIIPSGYWSNQQGYDITYTNGILNIQLAAPIPTLSEWGVILLAGMLGVFGVAGMRRRDVA